MTPEGTDPNPNNWCKQDAERLADEAGEKRGPKRRHIVGSIEDMICYRAEHRLPLVWLREHSIHEVYIAGNCLNRMSPNDVDMFPVSEHDCELWRKLSDEDLLSRTKNAATYKVGDGPVVQLCFYQHPSLTSLVESFDFTHVQVGAHVKVYNSCVIVDEVYYSSAWLTAHAIESTRYMYSKYPLSSMVRLVKYARRDAFSGKSYIASMLNILVDIVSRGFKDYDDFKDQLDAVDLGIVDKDIEGCDLRRLFDLLRRDV